jgi:fibronectin-binding autotransporter adhesin
MKLRPFTRKQILRAIHAAAVTIFLAAISVARAQTATGSNGNVTVSGTGNTSFVFGPTSTPPLASGGTLTIAAGTNDSVSTGSNSNIYTIQVQVPSTTTNSGYLSAYNGNNFSGGPATTLDISPTTTAGDVTIQNTSTGTITASTYMGSATAIDVENVQQGSISINNSGLLLVQGPSNAEISNLTGILANDSYGAGSITLINSGTITTGTGSTASAYGANLTASGSGGITVTNSGGITISANEGEGSNFAGLVLTSSGAGAITVANTGTITGSGYVSSAGTGIDATASGNGAVSISNGGTVNISNTSGPGGAMGINVNASGSGAVSVTDTGAITATAPASVMGISINDTGTGAATVTTTANGTINASSDSRSAYGILVAGNAAPVTITNAADITSGSSSIFSGFSVYGIDATGSGLLTVTNSGGISTSSAGAVGFVSGIAAVDSGTGNIDLINSGSISSSLSGYSSTAYGINATTGGGITINNSGSISTTSTDTDNTGAYGINAVATGNVGITNTGTLSVSNSGYDGGFGINAVGANVTIENAGALSVSSSGNYGATGIQAYAPGNLDLTNNSTITVSSSYGAYGIAANANGTLDLTNNSTITASSSYGAYGIVANETTGVTTINNTGMIAASSSGIYYTAYGVYAASSSGEIAITNDGTISGINTGGGAGYGIYASSLGPIVINNNGTALGTTSGIYLGSAGTVNNFGLASGGTYSIDVPTASTVNLIGASPVQGLIKGGADASSTSTLNFQIAIRGNITTARSELNAAIASYDAQYAAAMGNGNVDSTVVVLNNVDYQWEDFAAVLDNLVEGRLYADTPGFASLGGVLDNLPTNATSTRILTALNNVPDNEVAAALAELSPKELEVFRNVAFDNNTFNDAQINNHLANLRDGLTGFDSSALTVEDSSMDPSLAQVKSHLLAYDPASTPGLVSDSTEPMFGATDMKDVKSERVDTMPTERWSSFIAGDVILTNQSNNANLQDSNYTTGSVTGGVDYRVDQHFTIGALFAYSHTDADLDSRGSSATVDSYAPGIYASYVDGGWYGNGLASYVRNAYTEDREIDIAGLGGDNHGGTSGNQGSANLTGGYEFHRGGFKFGPVASLQYVHLSIDSIQEQGPTALNISSQDEDSLRSLLGFEARFVANVNTPLGPMSLTPHLSASWQHEYLDNGGDITSNFNGTGGGSFSTQTDSPDRDSAFVDVGLDATVSKNVTVFVDYETQAGQDNFFAQSAQGGVRIGF